MASLTGGFGQQPRMKFAAEIVNFLVLTFWVEM